MDEAKTKIRTHYLINPRFQLQFILLSLSLSLAIILVIYFFNDYYFQLFVEKGKNIELPQGHIYYQLLKEQKSKMNNLFAILSVVISAIIIIAGTILSHRIAGPLEKIKKFFENDDVAKGQQLNLRKKDYFQDVSESINNYFNKKL